MRQHIRHSEKFQAAEERRQREREERLRVAEESIQQEHRELIDGIARRLVRTIRIKHNGALIASSLYQALDFLAIDGGIAPKERRNYPQALIKEALECAIERNKISMTVMDSGEIVLSVWPPVTHDEEISYVGHVDKYQHLAPRASARRAVR